MHKFKSLNINKNFYKKLGFWVGLSLLYETFGLFHHDQLFSITANCKNKLATPKK